MRSKIQPRNHDNMFFPIWVQLKQVNDSVGDDAAAVVRTKTWDRIGTSAVKDLIKGSVRGRT